MNDRIVKPKRKPARRKWALGLMLAVVVVALCGCKTLTFYTQAARGQYQIFAHEHSIEALLHDPKTPEKLKKRFELLLALRVFADKELKLPVDGHYRKYVDLHRPFVVWNVQAAPEFSMEPKTWWYPLVGSLAYRGYFFQPYATNYAAYLRQKGYDVAVGGVEAYSTLGWFKDPVLNTFIFEPDGDLAELIFHELGHQRVFARGDTDFNEAFATTVGQEGVKRWLKARGDETAMNDYLLDLKRHSEFVMLVLETRRSLEALYGDTHDKDGKVKHTDKNRAVPAETLRSQKAQIYRQLKQQFEELKAKSGGLNEYNYWFTRQVNNAHLNSIAEYYDLVPGFEQLLALNGGDLEKFYEAAARLASKPKKERLEWLRNLKVAKE